MNVNDVGNVLPIAADTLFNPWSEKMFLEELAHSPSHCFLLYCKGDGDEEIPLGFICFRNVGEESELLNIAVSSHHRQKGLGKKLMAFYIDFCKGAGITKYFLEVSPENVSALHLYQSFGYQPTGTRKRFYQGKYDARVMEKRTQP